MKRGITLSLAIILVFCLLGCGKQETSADVKTNDNTSFKMQVDTVINRDSNSESREDQDEESGEAITEEPVNEEKESTLYYAENLASIPDYAIDKLKKRTEEDITDQIEKEAERTLAAWGEDLVYTLNELKFIGNYFLYLKEDAPNAFGGHNVCCCIYEVNLKGKEDFSFYTAVEFSNIQVAEDGSYSCNTDSRAHTSTTIGVPDGASVYQGCESLERIFEDCKTTYGEKYTYESTVNQ